MKQANLELEKKDGLRRHFRYDWDSVARYVPEYRQYVENERNRLGEDHPLFRTQYLLRPITSGGGLFNRDVLAMIEGKHRCLHGPSPGRQYIAGINIAGEAEETYSLLNDFQPRQDSTVVTIAEIDSSSGAFQPSIHLVEHYCWTGKKHSRLLPKLVHLLGKVWRCSKIVVNATGIGQPVASLLKENLGSRVETFGFTTQSKSELGFELLSAVNSGRLKMYAGDGSAEYRRFFHELEHSRACYQAGWRLNIYVDRADGHDDFLISLALMVRAARGFQLRLAKGV